MSQHAIRFNDSIAAQLLRIIFGLYLLVTILITLSQLAIQYFHVRDTIAHEMRISSATFGPGIAESLWTYNESQLHSILLGMVKMPIVTGVLIQDEFGNEIDSMGNVLKEIPQAQEGFISFSFYSELFGYAFPIVYSDDDFVQHKIGSLTVFSSTNIVFERLIFDFILTIIASIIKTVALWGLFLFFLAKLLGKPLEELTVSVANLKWEKLGSEEISLAKSPAIKHPNELMVLESTFQIILNKLSLATTEIKKSESRLRQIIDLVPHMIFAKDKDGNIHLSNKAYACIYTTDEKGTLYNSNTSSVEDLKVIEKDVKMHFPETSLRDAQGNQKIFQVSKMPFDISGTKTALGVAVDITELKNTQKQLRLLNDELEARIEDRTSALKSTMLALEKAKQDADLANRAKSIFLTNMSHEIRTPLNAILGFTEVLEEHIVDSSDRDYLDSIKTSGKALLTLINDILDLSKIEAGKTEIHPQDVLLHEIIFEVGQIFSQQLQEKRLVYQVEISSDLPPALILDSNRIRQVLLNLLSNAIKFTHKGTIRLSAHEKLPRVNKNELNLLLEVEDTGIGIPSEQFELIFGDFNQRVGQSSHYGGTGLGLSITRLLVKLMGGEISVQSEEGQGSRFEILLPRVKIGDVSKTLLETDFNENPLIDLENGSVLFSCESKSEQALVKAYLKDQKLIVDETNDPSAIIELAEKNSPKIILLDLSLSLEKGYEIINKIRCHDKLKPIPIVVLTASAYSKKNDKLANVCQEMLIKPFSRKQLVDTLTLLLRNSEVEPKSNGVAPHESLLNALEKQRARWETLAQPHALEIQEILTFAQDMESIGSSFGFSEAESWGKMLHAQASKFSIMALRDTLTQFPDIVENAQMLVEKYQSSQES